MDVLIIGCGLSGSVIARQLADKNKKIKILERRNHIGGNLYDYIDDHGILVQQYGPHIFHTNDETVWDYVNRFSDWNDYKLVCGASWDGKYTPTAFNFKTIDTFYSSEDAEALKAKIKSLYNDQPSATVVELLNCQDDDIRGYAEFLFKNDYAPYTAKQWGISPEEIDPSVLQRVPIRFSYDESYFTDKHEAMPAVSYTAFISSLLDSPNISVSLNCNALDVLTIDDKCIFLDGKRLEIPVIYTGPIDELFDYCFGQLPYRSLRFEWKYSESDSIQPAPVVAYPQEPGYTRITEYKKLPVQNAFGSSYAVEYPIPFTPGNKVEPYYPIPTASSTEQYQLYRDKASAIPNLICCGRLADYKYYNMDQIISSALKISEEI